ncbi:hypothetical protein AB205_0148760, partial [Aquarana catesbeiana]
FLYLLCRNGMSYCYTVMLLCFIVNHHLLSRPFSCSTDLSILTATAFAPTIHQAVNPAL